MSDLPPEMTNLSNIAALLSANSKLENMNLNLITEHLTEHFRQPIDLTKFSDGFLLNHLLTTLQDYSLKVIMENVDPMYIFNFQHSLIDLSSDPKLKFSKEEFTEWVTVESQFCKEVDFSTRLWFLTFYCHHVALMPAIREQQMKNTCISKLRKKIDEKTKTESEWKNNPLLAAENEKFLEKKKLKLEKVMKSKSDAELVLHEQNFLNRCITFYSTVAKLMMNLLLGTPSVPNTATVVFPSKVPDILAAIPDWFVEDIAEFLIYILEVTPEAIDFKLMDTLLTWILVFFCAPAVFRDSEKKFKLMKILIIIMSENNLFSFMMMSHPLSISHLPSALIKYYTDNDSIHILPRRLFINMALNMLWKSDLHRNKLIQNSNEKSFVLFLNTLIKDTPKYLDIFLRLLVRMDEVQEIMANTEGYNTLSDEIQQYLTRKLSIVEDEYSSLILGIKMIIYTIHYITKDIKGPFMRPELVYRFTAMLNLYFQKMCGLKSTNITDNYKNDYYSLLELLVDIYLHLDCDQFVAAIAKDERYYRKELFEDNLKCKFNISNSIQRKFQELSTFGKKVNYIYNQNITKDKLYCDAPVEFEDKLFCILMDDPVILPSSRQIVDKPSILRHLFNSQTDPFTREPLSETDLIPATELKEKIDKWKLDKLKEHSSKDNP